jgi:hypothetical protein
MDSIKFNPVRKLISFIRLIISRSIVVYPNSRLRIINSHRRVFRRHGG